MIQISAGPIDVNEVVASVTRAETGAVATFLGTTRDTNAGRRVVSLEYEVYPGMAEQELEQIGREAIERLGATAVSIVHRVGLVPVGEASVVVAASAAHRKEAFEACRFAIDRLKEIVPIWKKERYEGGEEWIGVSSGGPCCRASA